jgi:hypothetical protein
MPAGAHSTAGLAEVDDAGLGRAVGRVGDPPVHDVPAHRGDVHDRSTVTRHDGLLRLTGEHHAVEVDVEHPVPLVGFHPGGLDQAVDPRTVHGVRHRPELPRPVDRGAHAGLVAHVDADVVGEDPRRPARLVESRVVGIRVVEAEHPDTSARDGLDDREADAASPARDDRDASCDQVVHGASSGTGSGTRSVGPPGDRPWPAADKLAA